MMPDLNFNPFPELQTQRLVLRPILDSDVEAVFALRSNPEVMKFVPRPLAKTLDDARAHIVMIQDKISSGEGINWAITRKGHPELIGIIGHYRIQPEHSRAEIGYMMLPQFHGNGYITEAVAEMVRFGFQKMQLHSIEAIIDPANVASARVLEKNKFVKEAHLRENQYYDGRFLDTVIYSLLKKDLET